MTLKWRVIETLFSADLYKERGHILSETQSPQKGDKKPAVGTTVPDLGKIQEELHAAVIFLDSAAATLESLPANHSRLIWKTVIKGVQEDIERYSSKLTELLSRPPKADKW
jgi:hypothetical protein